MRNDDMKTPNAALMPANDEIRVLREAYRLGTMGLDYVEEWGWERPFVDKLVAQGVLRLSKAGELMGERSYRVAEAGIAVAMECYAMYQNDLAMFLESFESELHDLLAPGVARWLGEDA